MAGGALDNGQETLNIGLMTTRRRALVLGDEAARHPFRRSLPPLRDEAPDFGWRRNLTARDWRDVLGAYCATFLAVTTFFS